MENSRVFICMNLSKSIFQMKLQLLHKTVSSELTTGSIKLLQPVNAEISP